MYAQEARRDRHGPASVGVRRPVAVPPPSTDGRPSALSAPENFIADGPLGRLSRRYLGRKALPLLALAGIASGVAFGVFLASSPGQGDRPGAEAVTAPPPVVPAPEPAKSQPRDAGLSDRFEARVPVKPSLADMPPPAMAAPEPVADAVPAKVPDADRTPPVRDAARLDALVGRGDALLASGEVAAARLFYGRAFAEGDPRGAVGMARTYDEAALKGLPGVALKGDPAEAARWKRRAEEAGAAAR